uniref:Uncharacterized protein n=1 Tax=Anguilla anguilla TaxID=7936 RepID=A0A0E9WB83_ANGAN
MYNVFSPELPDSVVAMGWACSGDWAFQIGRQRKTMD